MFTNYLSFSLLWRIIFIVTVKYILMINSAFVSFELFCLSILIYSCVFQHSYLKIIYFLSLWCRHFGKRLNISQNYSHIRLWSLSADTPGTWWAHRCSVLNSSRWPSCGEHPRRWPWQRPIVRRAGARLWRNKENTVRCVFNDFHVLGVQALNSSRCRGICRKNREVKFIF